MGLSIGVLPAIGITMQMIAAFIVFFALGIPWLQRKNAQRSAVPGPSFWFPVVGESMQLMQSPFKYAWTCWLSYGGIFRTSLLGELVYVVGTQEALRVIWSDDDAFEFYVPGKAFSLLISDIRHMREPRHHVLFRRKLSQALSPAAVSLHLLGPMEAVMQRHLDSWEEQGRVELGAACEELSMDVALEVITGQPLPQERTTVRRLFRTVLDGLYGLPVVLPGTALYKALAARRRLQELLWPLVEAEAAKIAETMQRSREHDEEPESSVADGTGAGGGAVNMGQTANLRSPSSTPEKDGKEKEEEGGSMATSFRSRRRDIVPAFKRTPVRMLEAQISSALAAVARAEGGGRSGELRSLLSPEQLFERALGTVIAVDETSRHLFFGMIAALALAPEVRSRAEEEQRHVLRKYGNDTLSYNVLSDMPYLDAVVKETLRLLPVSIGGFRIAKRDVTLRGGCSGGPSGSGQVIPRGAVVFWSTHLAHCCDPALLPRTLAPEPAPGSSWFRNLSVVSPWAAACDMATSRRERVAVAIAVDTAAGRRAVARGSVGPSGLPAHLDYQSRFEEAFRPERWLSEETRPKQWVAFGGGGHLCLGQHVALAEAKLLLTLLLRRFDIRLEDPDILRKATMFPGPKPRRGTDGLLITPRRLEP